MACINKNHPEFKALVAQTGENVDSLAADVAMWMEEHNTDVFPTINELEAIINPQQKYYSYSPIKQLGFKYNTNTAGFMPKNVPLFQVKKDAERLGLSVKKARSGNWYFVNQRGRFINPHNYQLKSEENRLPHAELNDKLIAWAEKHGIKVQAIEETIYRLGENDKNDGIVAVADLLNNLITINKDSEKIDTLAEEIAHFATAILEDDASVKKAMESIVDTEIYKKVKEDYKDVYFKESDFRKEAVDKLLAEKLVEGFEETQPKGVLAYIKAAINKFWRWVSNIKNNDAGEEIKNELYPIAKRILAGDYMGTIEGAENMSTTQFAQLEENENVEETKEEEKSEVDIAKGFLTQTVNKLEDRLIRLRRASGNKESKIKELETEILRIRKSLEEEKFRAGILGIVSMAEMELKQIQEVLDEHEKKGILHSNTYEGIEEFIESYQSLFNKFSEDMHYYDFNKTLRDQMNESMLNLHKEFIEVTKRNNVLRTKSFEKTINDVNTNSAGEKIDTEIDPKKMSQEIGTDISYWRALVGNFKQSSSSLLRSAWKLVHQSNLNVARKKNATAERLVAAQVLMEKAGYKASDLVAKTLDKDGKATVPTQFLIRERDHVGYKKAWIEYSNNIVKELGFENWAALKQAQTDKKLTKEQRDVFKKAKDKFNKKHPTEPIFEDGEIVGYQPKARDPRYKELMKNEAVKNYYNLLLEIKEDALKKLPSKYRNDLYKYMLPGIRSQFIEKLYRSDVSFSDNIKQFFHESLLRDQDDTEFGETTQLGNKMVPIYFTHMFENTQELSTDLTKTFTLFTEMAENFYEKNRIAGDMWSILKHIENKDYSSSLLKKGKKQEGASTNEYKAVKTLLDSQVYSGEQKDFTVKMPKNKFTKFLGIQDKELSISKVVNKLTGYIRTTNLALNPFTSTAGYLKGTADTILEDQIGRYTTVESKNWARKEYAKNISEVLAQSVSKKQTNKMHLMMRYNNVIDINSILRNTERSKLASNLAKSDNLFINYKLADYPIKGRIMLAVYHNHRLVDGNFIDRETFRTRMRKKGMKESEIKKEWKALANETLYDAYEVVNGQLQVKEKYKELVTDKLQNKVTGAVEHVSNTVDGTMSKGDKGSLSRQIYGEFLLMHRGWFINMLDSRFMKRNVNLLTEKEDMGYYPAMWEFIKKDLFGGQIGNWGNLISRSYWKEMTEKDSAKVKGVKRGALDIMYFNIIGFLAALTNIAADDADEDEFVTQYAAYQMNRVLLEQASGNPLWNWGEILQIIDNPVVGVNTIKELVDLSEMFNTSEVYERGMYKDKSHASKWWMRRMPGYRSLYEAQFPDQKNKFMKTVLDSGVYNLLKDKDPDETSFTDWFKAILREDTSLSSEEAFGQAMDTY